MDSINSITAYDQAAGIRGNSKEYSRQEGETIVKILLDERSLSQLADPEINLLSLGYNWWGKHDLAYQASLILLQKQPLDESILEHVYKYLWNAHCHRDFPEECDRLIKRNLGPSVFWHLSKAAYLTDDATGFHIEEIEWEPNMPVKHPHYAQRALQEIQMARLSASKEGIDFDRWYEKFAHKFAPLAAYQ